MEFLRFARQATGNRLFLAILFSLIIGTAWRSVAWSNSSVAPKGLLSREGISYELKHLNKHLPDTAESARLIRKEGSALVFKDKATLSRVERELLESGESLGTVRGWERYGKRFDKPIGYRIDAQGNKIPLHYGELKLNPQTGLYHIIPRTGPTS